MNLHASASVTEREPLADPHRLPLSEEQRGLLVEHLLDPARSSCLPLVLDFRGPFDAAAFERSLATLVRRHPVLTGRVIDADGTPELELRPEQVPAIERRTLDEPLTLDDTGAAPADLLRAELGRGLDLGAGVIRVVLYRHSAQRHTVLLVVHHVVVDGESSQILLRDLVTAYQQGAVPGPEPVPFEEYVRERATAGGRVPQRVLEYWQERFADAALKVDFPVDVRMPEAGRPEPAALPIGLDAGDTAALRRFARTCRAGVPAVLLAAYLTALARYSRQAEPVVALPMALREDARFARTVGYFGRTLLVRSPDAGEFSAAGFVSRVQAELARTMDHAAPFSTVARLLPAADPADTQPFNCVFIHQSWADPAADPAGTPVGEVIVRWRQDVHPAGLGLLTVEIYEHRGEIRGRLKYDAAQIHLGTAEAFADHLLTLARQFVVQPDRPVAELDGLSPSARTTLARLNDTGHPIPGKDLDTLFRERVAAQPEQIAVEFGDRRWTYQHLDERVGVLAEGLAGHGVHPGDRVGLLIPRSAEAVAVLLAIARCGAAYVPLDPAHPVRRREHIVGQCAPRVVVVSEETAAACPVGQAQVRLDELAGGPRAAVTVELTGRTALHILYTSGSTGTPKGVQLSHGALVANVLGSIRYFGIGQDDAMMLKAPFTFDVSAHEILVALLSGARLVVAPPESERDPDLLAETVERHRVTVLHVVPSQLRLLLEVPVFAANRSLRALVCTGETLPADLRRAFEKAHPARIHNAYGPTETAYTTVFSPPRNSTEFWTARAEVPIGRPVDNVRCYVLDESRRPLPPGAPGELYVGGASVSDGYFRDTALTRERFVEVDGGDGFRERLYRTGDLVRLLPDGSLTHLGRLDDQVKVNGNRVELGEVRAALIAVPGVVDATVQATRHTAGSTQLVAYAAADGVDGAGIRDTVAKWLPPGAVPARVIVVPRIPLLSNGKIDRPALALMERDAPADADPGARPAAAPSRPALEIVRTLWTELLGPPPAAELDRAQFFASGGDSILAMQLVSRLRRAGFPLTLRDLYRNPVLTDLAAVLDGAQPRQPRARQPRPESTVDVPLGPVQEWFFTHIRSERHQWNQSVLLELLRPVPAGMVRLALQAMVTAHPALSACFEPDPVRGEGRMRMVPAEPFSAYPPREVLWVRDIDGDDELDAAIAELQGSLDPFAGVHVRALLARGANDGADLLLITVHHLVVDGVSWRIMLEDFEHALEALENEELPALPAEECTFGRWVGELAALAAEAQEAAYWRATATTRRSVQALLRSATTIREASMRRFEFPLGAAATIALIGPVPARLGISVHDLVQGAVGHALARWRGCDTVTFDVETHGRTDRNDLHRTVGWFTAIHPLVLTADRTVPTEDYLAAVAPALTGVPAGGAGFGACRELSPDPALRAELAGLPPALICLNYYGQVDRLSPRGGFRMSRRLIPWQHSPRCERVYSIEIYGIVHDGRLRFGLLWSPSPADGIDEQAIQSLLGQLQAVLSLLAGRDLEAGETLELTAAPSEIVPEPDQVALTPQQHGLLLDALAHRDTGRYVEQLTWRWHGPLDPPRFRRAWQVVAARHAVLRAAFDWAGQLRLVLHEPGEPELSWYPDGKWKWDELAATDRARGFDLARPGLLRLAVCEGAGNHRLLLTFHHALLDGWSVSLLIQEFYRAYLDPRLPAVGQRPDLHDYARWVQAQDTGPAREFWRTAIPGGELVTAPGVPGAVTGETGSGRVCVRLDRADADRLRAWAAAQVCTESTVLHAVWAALLWRFADLPDAAVSFGVTVSGRGVPIDGVERICGLLMNTLPLVVDVQPCLTTAALLAAVRDRVLEMSAFDWVSTGQIHEWSGRRGRDPLAQSILAFENYPRSRGRLAQRLGENGVQVELPDAIGSETAYPLTLLAYRDAEDGLTLTVVHDRARLDDLAGRRVAVACERVLRRLADAGDADPTVAELVGDLPAAELPLFAERPRCATRPVIRSGDWPAEADPESIAVVERAWRTVLGVAEVSSADHFFEAGGHSLLAVHLLRELHRCGGRPIRLDDLLIHPTAGELARFLAGAGSGTADGILVPLRPGDTADPVYLVHPPGGQVACYAELARCYPGSQRLVGIRDSRVDDPHPPYRTTEELAAAYLDALASTLHDCPPVLAGFSGGGVIAYELAVRIAAAGHPAPLVVLVDAGAPDGARTNPEVQDEFLRQLRERGRRRGQFTMDKKESGAELPADASAYVTELGQIADWMRGAGRGDPLGLMRDTVEAVQRYRPRPYDGPVVVLRAGDTGFGRGSGFDDSDRYHRMRGLGWEKYCERLSVHEVPGNHVTLMSGANVRTLAKVIAQVVGEYRAAG